MPGMCVLYTVHSTLPGMPREPRVDQPVLRPLRRPQALAEQVYQALREQLRGGAVGAGQPLQEVPLAAQLGVSRTPVREALARLASEGLLATDQRSFTVPELTLADVDDIYEVRFLIEPAAMRRIAAHTRDAGVRAPVDAALAAAAAAHKAQDAAAFRQANVRFRDAWLALVPNPRLVRVIALYADHMQHIRTITLDRAAVRDVVLGGLARMTAALAAGDSEGAAAAVHQHLHQARLAFIEALGLHPDPARAAPPMPPSTSTAVVLSSPPAPAAAPAGAAGRKTGRTTGRNAAKTTTKAVGAATGKAGSQTTRPAARKTANAAHPQRGRAANRRHP